VMPKRKPATGSADESLMLYRSGKPFRMKGGEVERVKGIESSAQSKPQ